MSGRPLVLDVGDEDPILKLTTNNEPRSEKTSVIDMLTDIGEGAVDCKINSSLEVESESNRLKEIAAGILRRSVLKRKQVIVIEPIIDATVRKKCRIAHQLNQIKLKSTKTCMVKDDYSSVKNEVKPSMRKTKENMPQALDCGSKSDSSNKSYNTESLLRDLDVSDSNSDTEIDEISNPQHKVANVGPRSINHTPKEPKSTSEPKESNNDLMSMDATPVTKSTQTLKVTDDYTGVRNKVRPSTSKTKINTPQELDHESKSNSSNKSYNTESLLRDLDISDSDSDTEEDRITNPPNKLGNVRPRPIHYTETNEKHNDLMSMDATPTPIENIDSNPKIKTEPKPKSVRFNIEANTVKEYVPDYYSKWQHPAPRYRTVSTHQVMFDLWRMVRNCDRFVGSQMEYAMRQAGYLRPK